MNGLEDYNFCNYCLSLHLVLYSLLPGRKCEQLSGGIKEWKVFKKANVWLRCSCRMTFFFPSSVVNVGQELLFGSNLLLTLKMSFIWDDNEETYVLHLNLKECGIWWETKDNRNTVCQSNTYNLVFSLFSDQRTKSFWKCNIDLLLSLCFQHLSLFKECQSILQIFVSVTREKKKHCPAKISHRPDFTESIY